MVPGNVWSMTCEVQDCLRHLLESQYIIRFNYIYIQIHAWFMLYVHQSFTISVRNKSEHFSSQQFVKHPVVVTRLNGFMSFIACKDFHLTTYDQGRIACTFTAPIPWQQQCRRHFWWQQGTKSQSMQLQLVCFSIFLLFVKNATYLSKFNVTLCI